MWLILSALLTSSIASSECRAIIPAYDLEWRLPEVPRDLPAAQEAPQDGHWLTIEGVDGGPGVWLPPATAKSVTERLAFLKLTGRMCQVQLDKAAERYSVDVASATDVALADAGIERVKIETKPEGWSSWQVGLMWVGAFSLGAMAGGAAVLIAR